MKIIIDYDKATELIHFYNTMYNRHFKINKRSDDTMIYRAKLEAIKELIMLSDEVKEDKGHD